MASVLDGERSVTVERITVDGEQDLGRAAERAAETLRNGGIVLHPTETVYGLGGDGSEASNELISDIKGREPDQPLLVLTPDSDALSRTFPGLRWPPLATELARRFWPGPLTLVLPCSSAPEGLLSREGGLAARVSPDPVVSAILERWGGPMTSTSANRSGAEPARSVAEALGLFEGNAAARVESVPVLAVDAGPRMGRPSTIVSLVGPTPRLLREGPVTRDALRDWLHDS